MLENIQSFLVSICLVLLGYYTIVLFNKWYYPYFIEKINRRATKDFNAKEFKNLSLQFLLIFIAFLLVLSVPALFALSIMLIVLILVQFSIINKITNKIKQMYGMI